MKINIIAFITDFSRGDSFVSEMHTVLFSTTLRG